MSDNNFRITFWGVRGSLPVPGPDTIKFGGNTSCVQVQVNNRLLILDAGTGISKLGQHLTADPGPISGDIFITHTHWDHIQGFPFFTPAFKEGNQFVLYGIGRIDATFTDLMKGQMLYEHFPVSLEEMKADIHICELSGAEILDLNDGITVRTFPNNHPGGGLSYRIDYEELSCCYVSDYEHCSPTDNKLIDFINESDLVIYDCHFTDQEYFGYDKYSSKAGWGHSTWQEGVKLIKAANAKKLVLFHHANFHTDKDMEEIEREAQAQYSDLLAAREGMIIQL